MHDELKASIVAVNWKDLDSAKFHSESYFSYSTSTV